MPEIVFEGDWDADEVQQAAIALQQMLGKSVSMGDAIPDELNPPTVTGYDAALAKRRRKLMGLLRDAGTKALAKDEEPCDESKPDWSAYGDLKKDIHPGSIRQDHRGRFVLTQNNRWKKVDDSAQLSAPAPPKAAFTFPVTDGLYGDGVYLPVLPEPTGHLRLRVRLSIAPDELISDEQFQEAENDLTQDTDLILDGQGVKAIARSTKTGVVDLLMVRRADDIEVLGIISNSGVVPQGDFRFGLVSMTVHDDSVTADIEMVANELIDPVQGLAKSASALNRSTLHSSSYLKGTPLVRVNASPLDRGLVKEAIARCRLDGVNLDGIEICRVSGVPDFLPMPVRAFCLPSDSRICLCPHDPQGAIASLCDKLATRLQAAVRAGAMPGDVALDILARAARLTPDWFLEVLIKRYAGAIACEQRWHVMDGGEPPKAYMNLLVGRGTEFWGNRKTVLECMAEDYRCAHDPAGLPNLVSLEWDAAVPGLVRASQQLLVNLLGAK